MGEADKIAIATIENKVIKSVKYITTTEELKAQLQ
jgi:hypothetical protein